MALALLLPVACWYLAEQPQAVQLSGEQWTPDTGSYAGSGTCRECHADIVEQQLASNHARTIRDLSREAPLAPVGNGQTVTDPLTGARYSMQKNGGKPAVTVTSGELSATQKLDFEFGSGVHAHGYLGKIDDTTWLDARLNYYAKIRAWDFTSGQEKPNAYLHEQPLGKPQGPADVMRCFSCHSTVLRAYGVGKLPLDGSQLRVAPERSELGITCERCHGPRQEHVRLRKFGIAEERPLAQSADQMNQLCGQCHGLSNVSAAHPVIARFQPWGLERSRCFRASAGRLSCSTCHDPHRNVSKDPSFYEAKCLSCHSGSREAVGKTVCPVNRKSGCVGCHMPHDSKSMLHTTFTDHRIRVPSRTTASR